MTSTSPSTRSYPKARLWELAAGRYLDEHAAVLFCGPTGVGDLRGPGARRGRLSSEIGASSSARPAPCLPISRAGVPTAAGSSAWRRYLGPELLIFDDFALREYTAVQAEDLYELVSRHYRRGSLIFTTNREPKDLDPLFPNAVIAEGLLDRLLSSAYVVTMLGQSHRPQQRPDLQEGARHG